METVSPTLAGRLDSKDSQDSRFLFRIVGDFSVILVLWEGVMGDCLGDFVVGSTLTEHSHFVIGFSKFHTIVSSVSVDYGRFLWIRIKFPSLYDSTTPRQVSEFAQQLARQLIAYTFDMSNGVNRSVAVGIKMFSSTGKHKGLKRINTQKGERQQIIVQVKSIFTSLSGSRRGEKKNNESKSSIMPCKKEIQLACFMLSLWRTGFPPLFASQAHLCTICSLAPMSCYFYLIKQRRFDKSTTIFLVIKLIN